MALASEEYRSRARRMLPSDRAEELAIAGVPADETAAALHVDGLALPEGYTLPAVSQHDLLTMAGRAYQRHTLYLQGMTDPKSAELIATNKLGFSRGPLDKEIAAQSKALQNLTQAQVLAKIAEIAREYGVDLGALAHGSLPQNAQVTQLGPGTQRASGTELGTVLDVEPETS